MIRLLLLSAVWPLLVAPVLGQEETSRTYQTVRTTVSPEIDGRLDDPAWEAVEWTSDFVQRQPMDGGPPSAQTEFKVVYDDDALYFGFRVHDDPALVSNILERRDSSSGDWVEVNIDSNNDSRTAFSFTLSLSGTRGDEFISRDGRKWDDRWNPVWSGATAMTETGWTGEMRILLSQLRFSPGDDQSWGLQVQRNIYRLEERSLWQRIPRDVEGWVSKFGDLKGLRGLKPKRRMEVIPYAVGSVESSPKVTGDPFQTGGSEDLEGGVDGKIGLTSNLTIDFTLNPDFGQVEADPSEVNLSAFESFFQERRPFFVERQDIFDLQVAPAVTGGSFTRDNLFYSRRIGRRPGFSPDLPEGAVIDQPDATTILGAFKLTGTTPGGLSIGVLDALTDEQQARVDLDGVRSNITVEPQTNFFVGRLRQDFREGDTQLGGIVTAVNRSLESHLEDAFRSEAYSGGVDFSTLFHDRDYRFEVSVFGSEIRGSEAVIDSAQRSSARYYQRPDNESARYDPTRTSLSGHAGSIRFERTNNHDIRFQTGVAWRSPGFEINDIGFLRDADQINQFTWVGYRKRNFGRFDQWNLNFNQWLDWDTSRTFLGARFNVNSRLTWTNKMSTGMSLGRRSEHLSNSSLRGGPTSKWPGSWNADIWFKTDPRKRLSFGTGIYNQKGDSGSGTFERIWFEVEYRPSSSLQISLEPSFRKSYGEMQYVETLQVADQDRFVFGRLDQETLSLEVRVDYSISPNLTVQFFAEPFAARGRYSEFKRITNPKASAYGDRWVGYSDSQVVSDTYSGTYSVDEDLDGVSEAEFSDPDFDFRELNSNLVVRWEFAPGSTLFVVWSEARFDDEKLPGSLGFKRDIDRVFSAQPTDVFLIKVSKWFSR